MKRIKHGGKKRTFMSQFNEVVEIPQGLGTISTTPAGDKEIRFDNTDPIQVAAMQVFFDRMILAGYQPHKVTPGNTMDHPHTNTLLRKFDASAECIVFASMKMFVG